MGTMMAMGMWFRPPRHLLVILVLLTLVSVSGLGWLGWRLLGQERVMEAQRAQDWLEQAADRIAATLRGSLAEMGEGLSEWADNPPSGDRRPREGILLILAAEPEAAPGVFAEGEALEFRQGQRDKAAEWYRRLAESRDAAVRAGALMRLGRVLPEAQKRAVYERLAGIGGVRVAGASAELVARHALFELSGEGREALKKDLLAGRWSLTRGQFEFYWSEVSRGDPPPAEAIGLVEAAEAARADWRREPSARGQRTIWAAGRPWFLMWRGSADRRAVLITKPESLLKQDAFFCALVDEEGRLVAGRKDRATRAAVRTAAESQLPWTLYVTSMEKAAEAARQRFLVAVLTVMVLFLVAGAYFIARAIRKEAAVSRLQSDFVSAVSHEFRSPLTALRQLSEILALGRAPNEERRQKYYETLVSETRRLQRLVETLLNFGKMEAGGCQYRFEEMEAGDLVAQVVAEFESQIAGAGRHIEVSGTAEGCGIEADPEALALALRNLIDNALKYSPNEPAVWVEWGPENGRVAIRVRDKGIGIAASERNVIFQRFVRGSAALAANVKGTGVGLAMVRHIVAAHRGEVQVTSEPGQGSTFTLMIPAMGKG